MNRTLDPATIDDGGLALRSVAILREGQHESGAFVACPTFPTYQYAWLRDGSFCARALDTVGDHAGAARFHRWVERTVLAHADLAERAMGIIASGSVPLPEDMLPTRYDLEGRLESPDDGDEGPWPNFQLDGYGTWLHELESHLLLAGETDFDASAVDLVARYLVASWRLHCHDCWEEFGDGQHASTLVAVAGGLASAGRLLDSDAFTREAEEVRTVLMSTFVRDGVLRKGATDDRVDASLLWAALPFGVLAVDDPVMLATAEEIRGQLTTVAGGVYRYLGDSYYGGGEWILLACWLAWYEASVGDRASFEWSRRWVTDQVLPDGALPEQVTDLAQHPEMIDPWVSRWGPIATPLLWSHAMYLIALEAAR